MRVSTLRAPALLGAVVALLGAALWLTPGGVEARTPKPAEAGLMDVDGASVGSVKFMPRDDGKVTVRVSVNSVEPGWHGIHIHTTGLCEPDAMDGETESPFFTAGTHWNPEETDHGTHPGDIPPLYVTEDGKGKGTYVTDRFKVKDLLDEDGSAVILHAGPDNLAHVPATSSSGGSRYKSFSETDPSYTFGPDTATRGTGDAGARFACGVVAKG
jgi:superoxide dismutase, Cu-Zn family